MYSMEVVKRELKKHVFSICHKKVLITKGSLLILQRKVVLNKISPGEERKRKFFQRIILWSPKFKCWSLKRFLDQDQN